MRRFFQSSFEFFFRNFLKYRLYENIICISFDSFDTYSLKKYYFYINVLLFSATHISRVEESAINHNFMIGMTLITCRYMNRHHRSISGNIAFKPLEPNWYQIFYQTEVPFVTELESRNSEFRIFLKSFMVLLP